VKSSARFWVRELKRGARGCAIEARFTSAGALGCAGCAMGARVREGARFEARRKSGARGCASAPGRAPPRTQPTPTPPPTPPPEFFLGGARDVGLGAR
jgi:hypothetical protein